MNTHATPPRTEAGKRLLDELALPWTPDMRRGYEAMVEGWRPRVAAIEAESVAAYRARLVRVLAVICVVGVVTLATLALWRQGA